jgi:hypothetical protein
MKNPRSPDAAKLPEIATEFVQNHLLIFDLDDPVLTDLASIIRSGLPYEEAAFRMEDWLMGKLAANPGSNPLFCDLSNNLIDAMLAQVDWEAIVGAMRRREE